MNYIKKILDSQIFMLKIMWKTSKLLFFITFINALIIGTTPPIFVLLTKAFVNQIEITKSWNKALFYIVLLIGVTLFSLLASDIIKRVTFYQKTYVSEKMDFDLFTKTCNMDLSLFESSEIKSLYQEASSATNNNRNIIVLDSFFSIFSNLITIILTTAILTFVEPWIFLLILIVIVLKAFSIIRTKKQQFANWKLDIVIQKEFVYHMRLLFDKDCVDEMKMVSLSSWIIEKYKIIRKKAQFLEIDSNKKAAINSYINHILSQTQEAFLYIFLAWRVIFNAMSFADFTMFFTAIKTFSSNTESLISTILDIGENSFYIESFRKYMEVDNVIAVEHKNDLRITKEMYNKDNIIIRNMSFKYPGSDNYVLKNVNLNLESEKFYLIVGANGAGKTTFIKLLCRLYDPTSGNICLSDTDIKKYNYKDYRSMIGIVFQNYKVYDYTIAENIAMNEWDNTDEVRRKVYDSIVKANMKEKIDSLSKGIDTPLGHNFQVEGVNLSGGETQKIALAKALYKDSPILILDEPSSALDALSENELIKTFSKATLGKTVFYISHRLSVAKYAQNIIFIDNNTVDAFGTHSELMKTCPKYAEMYKAQAQHYLDEIKQ
jgi:ABC-type multidrug transport system fused ATPase/permease subunit